MRRDLPTAKRGSMFVRLRNAVFGDARRPRTKYATAPSDVDISMASTAVLPRNEPAIDAGPQLAETAQPAGQPTSSSTLDESSEQSGDMPEYTLPSDTRIPRASNLQPSPAPPPDAEAPSPRRGASTPPKDSLTHADGEAGSSTMQDTSTAFARAPPPRAASSHLSKLMTTMAVESGRARTASSLCSADNGLSAAGGVGLSRGLRRSRDNSLVEVLNGLRTRVAFLTSQLAIAEQQASLAAVAPTRPAAAVCTLCCEPLCKAPAVAPEVMAQVSMSPSTVCAPPPPPPPAQKPPPPPSSPVIEHDLHSAPRRWSSAGPEDARAKLWPGRRAVKPSSMSPHAVQLRSTIEDATEADLESYVQSFKGFAAVEDLGLSASVPTTPRRGTRHRRARQELRTIVAKVSEGAVSRSRQNSIIVTPSSDLALEPTRIDTSRPTGAVDFADLELVRPLGSGAYGAVSLMRHAPTGVLYAVKAVSKAHITAGPNASKLVFRLRREREALYALRGHPCVLALQGTAADATHVYLITELCMGGELFGLLAEGPLPEEHALFYGASVLLALEAAHTRGIVFRDLKPENVLLDSAGWVRLADFGAAAYIGAPTAEAPAGRAMSRFGTFEYMSPEVARGDKAGHSLETDWWSLGALLFELLVGRTPCVVDGSESDMVVISRVASGEIIWPRTFEPQLSPDAHDLIAQLLTVDQERRLGSRARGGAASVRAHRFFDRADLVAIVNRCNSYPPPWIPSLVAADDTSFTPSHQDPGMYNSLRAAADSLTYDGAQWERHFAEF